MRSYVRRAKVDVALFIPDLGGGGAERVVVNLANAFAAQGKHVDVVLARAQGSLLSSLGSSVEIRDFRVQHRAAVVPALWRYLRMFRPQALFSHMDMANVAAILAHRLARSRARLIITSHVVFSSQVAGAGRRRDRLVARLMPRLYPHADAIVAVSQGIADDLVRLTRLPPERFSVIQNPIVTPDLFARSKEAVDHPWFAVAEPPVLLAVGRLTRQKDYPTLLRAFRRVRERIDARLVILGEGEERASLERLAAELGIAVDVDFVGFKSNPYAYMSRAAVFVMSSAWEGFGNVLVEAMACGTPVVSTDCPSGPREILVDGKYGRLVPVSDDESLTDAILEELDTLRIPAKMNTDSGRT